MAKTGATGINRLINAARFSWLGYKAGYKHEEAIRQETLLCIVFIPVALYLGETPLDKALLISSLLFILLVELLNSAIEAVVDRIGDEIHELSGRAKDMGSTAVVIALVMAVVVWVGVLWPE